MIEWKPISGYEGLYEVSNTGLVKSLPRHGTWSKEPRIMIGSVDNHGYPQVTLHKEGKSRTAKVHRLVAETFLQNPFGLKEINHIDENKLNNDVSNLEWCNRIYNVNYGSRTEKTRRPVVQMTKDGVFLAEYEGVRSAAIACHLRCAGAISSVCSGRALSAYGFKWKYKEE